MNKFYQYNIKEAYQKLGSSKKGLGQEEIAIRQEQYGKNILVQKKKKGILGILLDQFKDVLVIILIVAAIISWFMGSVENLIVISIVIIINAILGTVQYIKAERSLEGLKALVAPMARVIREGAEMEINAAEVVPGDIVKLEAGNLVVADGRIIEAHSLRINESALTGESDNIEKMIEAIKVDNLALGDQTNMVFSGSLVTYGRGKMLVTATGMNTETGKITSLLNSVEKMETPLQISLNIFSKKLAGLIMIICFIIFILSVYRQTPIMEALMLAVALAVAAIPEALSSIVTIVLALGTQRMAKEKAIIKDLKSAESLGSVSVICSDKTGTLTQNKMTVQKIYRLDEVIGKDELEVDKEIDNLLLKACVLCNDSVTLNHQEMGDPTEIALVDLAEIYQIDELEERKHIKRLSELPFDSDRKLMSTSHEINGRFIIFTKGATDVLQERIKWIHTKVGIALAHEDDLVAIKKANLNFSNQGLRVLAFAYKYLDQQVPLQFEDEGDYTFLGLVAMMDPPRLEAKVAVADCIRAGIKPIMITGDYKITAANIAKEIGILKEEEKAIEGIELDELSDEALNELLEEISVYARVSPTHKIRIVDAWQRKGKVVAMTGDGVNDAAALKKADIGIAMGITGTEVSKDAANMILADDNFATIVKAIANGRKIYDNIRNAIYFLLSGNLAAILCVFYAILRGLPSPLLPVQLLFMNLITDSLPAVAIGLENSKTDTLNEKPRGAKESFFNKAFIGQLLCESLLIFIVTMVAFYQGLNRSSKVAITMAFATLCLARLIHSLNCRGKESLFNLGLFSNHYIWGAFLIGAVLLAGVLSIGGMRFLFMVEVLKLKEVVLIIGLSILPTLLIQFQRLFRKK